MSITLKELRANLYEIVDQIINTGTSVEVQRNRHKIKIVLASHSKLDQLAHRSDVINGNSDDIVHCSWLQA